MVTGRVTSHAIKMRVRSSGQLEKNFTIGPATGRFPLATAAGDHAAAVMFVRYPFAKFLM
jgi:hypothetical protein